MLNPDSTLDEFTRAIAICQPEADLSTVLRIFQQTDGDSIAIPQENNGWGIIRSHSLLSLLAKSWQRLPLMETGHFINNPDRENFAERTIGNIWEAIEPAIVCQGKTRLTDFIASWQKSFFSANRVEYLIVNSLGQLQGKLDRDKFLQYLISKHDLQVSQTSLPNSLLSLLDLFDNLVLPLKIETSARQDCYVNRAWQESVGFSNQQHWDSWQKSNVSIAHWWMEQQFQALQPNWQAQSSSETSDRHNYCCLLDRASLVSTQIDSDLYQQYLKTAYSAIHYQTGERFSEVHRTKLEIEPSDRWDYLRIPLSFNREGLGTKLYWLVLAVEPSLFKNSDLSGANSSVSIKASTVDRLLTTIGHELKSPLTGILGLSKLLNSEKLGTLNQRQSFYLSLIHNSGNKLSNIVGELINLIGLTGENPELKLEVVDLELLCRQLYQQINSKLDSVSSTELELVVTNTKLELNIDPEAKIALVDRLRLSNIVSHLILETMQFSDFSSSAIQITIRADLEAMEIVLNNQIDKASIASGEKINVTNRGVSLNLTIANYLAEILQGEIKSEYGTDCCSFTLLLPNVFPQSSLSSLPLDSTVSKSDRKTPNLTILCLYPELEAVNTSVLNERGLEFSLKNWAEQDWSGREGNRLDCRYRIIEADGLEQAHTLARIWQLDAVVLDGYGISDPQSYFRSLQKSEYLSALPIIALDAQTTAAGNQVEGLKVHPCLLPAECRSIQDLIQVIHIATGI